MAKLEIEHIIKNAEFGIYYQLGDNDNRLINLNAIVSIHGVFSLPKKQSFFEIQMFGNTFIKLSFNTEEQAMKEREQISSCLGVYNAKR